MPVRFPGQPGTASHRCFRAGETYALFRGAGRAGFKPAKGQANGFTGYHILPLTREALPDNIALMNSIRPQARSDALYLDRTFDAAHYLQSEDRIHRFGLPKDQKTTIEIVECIGSIDEIVRERLGYKIGQMAEALNDSSLRPDPIPLDPTDIEDFEEYSTGLSSDDIQALFKTLSMERS